MDRGPLFSLGHLVATPAAIDAMATAQVNPHTLILKHLSGNWGHLDYEDRMANDRAVREGSRILSAYNLPTGGKVWVITEADRSSTTILLPDDY